MRWVRDLLGFIWVWASLGFFGGLVLGTCYQFYINKAIMWDWAFYGLVGCSIFALCFWLACDLYFLSYRLFRKFWPKS